MFPRVMFSVLISIRTTALYAILFARFIHSCIFVVEVHSQAMQQLGYIHEIQSNANRRRSDERQWHAALWGGSSDYSDYYSISAKFRQSSTSKTWSQTCVTCASRSQTSRKHVANPFEDCTLLTSQVTCALTWPVLTWPVGSKAC